jgi:hypothetical protein
LGLRSCRLTKKSRTPRLEGLDELLLAELAVAILIERLEQGLERRLVHLRLQVRVEEKE